MRLDYNKLAEARKKKGLTLGFAAEKIGVPASVLRKLESGQGNQSLEAGRENSFALYKIKIEELYFDKDIERINNV